MLDTVYAQASLMNFRPCEPFLFRRQRSRQAMIGKSESNASADSQTCTIRCSRTRSSIQQCEPLERSSIPTSPPRRACRRSFLLPSRSRALPSLCMHCKFSFTIGSQTQEDPVLTDGPESMHAGSGPFTSLNGGHWIRCIELNQVATSSRTASITIASDFSASYAGSRYSLET